MRVLLLNQTFYPDVAATAQHAWDLAQHLTQNGHDVCAISSRSIYGQKGSKLPKREVVDGVEIHRVGASMFGKSSILLRVLDFGFFYLLAALKAFTIRKPDVVITFTTPPFIALVGYAMKVIRRTKFVYWVMDLYPDLPVACGVMKPNSLVTGFFHAINRFCLRKSDRAVVLGRCMEQRVIDKGVDANQLSRIGVWADHTEVQPVPREANPYRTEWHLQDQFIVMYSGNFGIGHDIDTIAGAVERLKNRDDIRFVFVGGGKRMEEMKRLASERDLHNTQFHPYQPREKLNASLSLADLHLISLLDPVLGIMVPCKLYGIMASARPAVFVGHADSEIARTLVEDEAGAAVRCGDVDGLTGAIEALADDRQRAKQMGDAARRALMEKYDRRHRCEAWEALLTEIVEGKPHAKSSATTDDSDDSTAPAPQAASK